MKSTTLFSLAFVLIILISGETQSVSNDRFGVDNSWLFQLLTVEEVEEGEVEEEAEEVGPEEAVVVAVVVDQEEEELVEVVVL